MKCHRVPDPVDISASIVEPFNSSSRLESNTDKSKGKFPPMRFLDNQKYVIFNLTNQKIPSVRCDIQMPLHLTPEIPVPENQSQPLNSKGQTSHRGRRSGKVNTSVNSTNLAHESGAFGNTNNNNNNYSLINVPVAQFEVDPNFVCQRKPPVWKKGCAYLRFVERSPEELDEIVEYDLDEEVVLLYKIVLLTVLIIPSSRIFSGWRR